MSSKTHLMDNLSIKARSNLMSRVRSQDSVAEMTVRKTVHRLGYRYRLHVRTLPGCPDLVFRSRKKIIFVHGCFWHGHTCRAGRNRPASKRNYWEPKLNRNAARDRSNAARLRRDGWKVLSIWECQVRNENLASRLKAFLETE
jgi:DNA mismatch endonuclease (patch repair protein)